jgi:membrane protein YqaA with SNARE-associated domain
MSRQLSSDRRRRPADVSRRRAQTCLAPAPLRPEVAGAYWSLSTTLIYFSRSCARSALAPRLPIAGQGSLPQLEVLAVTFRTLALLIFSTLAREVFAFFRRMGALGLFLLGVFDSSFLILPFSNDFLLIALVSSERHPWQWVIYTIAAALGSVVGVTSVDLVMRKAGDEELEKFVSRKRLQKLKGQIEKRGVWGMFFAALLPPPFPFTAAIATASALQMARRHMLPAVFTGRLVRFTAESLLALYFGRRLLRYLRSEYVEYVVYFLIGVAAVGTFLTVRKWLRSRA